MNDRVWLDKVVLAEKAYNDTRMHTDVQHMEVLKFVAYLHRLYGYEYEMPLVKHNNEPHKIGN